MVPLWLQTSSYLLSILLCIIGFHCVRSLETICEGDGCTTKLMLDAFAKLQGESEFDGSLWNRLRTCMSRYNPTGNYTVLQIADSAWTGTVLFAATNGSATNPTNSSDPWIEVPDEGWIEHNATPLIAVSEANTSGIPGGTKFLVNEPCNTISNIAYYRSMLALCENPHFRIHREALPWLISVADHVGWGSMVKHTGFTRMSTLVDNVPIRIIALIAHQNSLRSLPFGTITHDLDDEPRIWTSLEMAAEFDRILIEYADNPYEWRNELRRIRNASPPYRASFGGIFTSALLLALPDVIAVPILNLVSEVLAGGEEAEFLSQTLVPALQQSFQEANVDVRIWNKASLLRKALGTGIKLIYALYWQEKNIPGPHTSGVTSNRLGGRLFPAVNAFCNFLTRYNRRSDINVQLAKNVYPSDERCRIASNTAHSKWHEMSANGLVDLLLLAEDINDVIEGRRVFGIGENQVFNCFAEHDCMSDFIFFDANSTNMTEASIEACVPQTADEIPTTSDEVQSMLECLALGESTTTSDRRTLWTAKDRQLWTNRDHGIHSCITLLMNPESENFDSLNEQCQQQRLFNSNNTNATNLNANPDNDEHDDLDEDSDALSNTNNNGFANGIPKLAQCSAVSCRFSYTQMVASFTGLPACVHTCRQNENNNVVHCLVGCYAGLNFM